MDFAPGSRPRADARCSRGAAPRVASASPRKSTPAASHSPECTPVGKLARRAEFVNVAKGRHAPVPGFVLQARLRVASVEADPSTARFGFTATRKLGGAVVRNRAKRRLRAVVRHLAARHARPGYDYVLIAREGTLQRPFAALLDDFRVALQKAHRQELRSNGDGGSA